MASDIGWDPGDLRSGRQSEGGRQPPLFLLDHIASLAPSVRGRVTLSQSEARSSVAPINSARRLGRLEAPASRVAGWVQLECNAGGVAAALFSQPDDRIKDVFPRRSKRVSRWWQRIANTDRQRS